MGSPAPLLLLLFGVLSSGTNAQFTVEASDESAAAGYSWSIVRGGEVEKATADVGFTVAGTATLLSSLQDVGAVEHEVEIQDLWGNVDLEAGEKKSVVCTVYNPREDDIIVWTIGDKELTSNKDIVYNKVDDSMKQKLILKAEIWMDKKVFSCRCRGKSETFTVSVHKADFPAKVILDKVSEGENLTLQDVTWNTYDLPGYGEIVFSYTLVKKLLNWNEAKEFCAARGAILAEPDSHAKNEDIKANLPSNDSTQTWFGARKVNNRWQYTTDLISMHYGYTLSFTNWNPGSPSGDGSCTTYLGRAMPWNDAPCGNKYYFICEKSTDSESMAYGARPTVGRGYCPRCYSNTDRRGCLKVRNCRRNR